MTGMMSDVVMKAVWEEKKLGDVCEVIAGQSPESEYYNNDGNGLPFYQGKIEFTEKYIGSPKVWTSKITKEAIDGDILLSVRAPVGPTNFATQKICIGRGLAAIRATKNVDREFLFYFMKHHENKIESNDGAVFKSINKTQIKNISIPLPPLSEQKEIVNALDEMFAKIDKAKANIEKNIDNVGELFQSKLNEVFSEKGDGWINKKLSDVCSFDKSVDTNQKLMYVGLENIESNTGKFIKNSSQSDAISSTFHFNNRHLLYGRLRPYLNKVFLPDFEGRCSTEIFPILVNDNITREFLYYWFTSEKIVKKIDSTRTGARMPRANMNEVLTFEIPIPPLSEQKEIVDNLNRLKEQTDALKEKYTQKLLDLEELKKSCT